MLNVAVVGLGGIGNGFQKPGSNCSQKMPATPR